MVSTVLGILGTTERIDQAEITSTPDVVTRDEFERIVFQHGAHFDSYLATEPGRKEFWCSDRSGLISYTQRGRYILISGGIIAPEKTKEKLLAEFRDYANAHNLGLAFHNISDSELPMFRSLGFEITKWGEEPIIDLGQRDWKGKAYEFVRRQTNYCVRHQVRAFEVAPSDLTPEQWNRTLEEMLEVAAESLSQKSQRKEMRFFEGNIDDHEIGRRRVFIARSNEGLGRIEAFVVCNPILGGTSFATEMYRRRVDAVRGTMTYLFHHIERQMQEEGVRHLYMCLDPALRCWQKIPGDSWIVRLGMTWGEAGLGFVFDVAGVRHFKSRFRPRYENRYVGMYPKATIRSTLAFLHVSGLFDISVRKLCRNLWQRIRKSAARNSLVKLDEPKRVHQVSAPKLPVKS